MAITMVHTDFLKGKKTYDEALKIIIEKKLIITEAIEKVEKATLKLANPLLNTYLLMKYLDLKDLLKESDKVLDSISSTMSGGIISEDE